MVSSAEQPGVALGIPCHNEAPAVAAVIAAWRRALPEAEIVIFDNDSTDGTGDIARALGVRVVEVPARGKGNAVRAMFETLADRQAVVMVDGDGTYPAEAVGPMLRAVLDGKADMAVGARRPVDAPGAMTPVRGVGNVLIRAAFRVLIGPGTGDLLSGYRVFSARFLREVRPRSTGFEIEAELASEAVCRRLRTVEVPIAYHPRFAGTRSKLKAFRDGRRIVGMIAMQGLRYRPWRLLILLALACLAPLPLGVGARYAAGAALALLAAAALLAAWHRLRDRP